MNSETKQSKTRIRELDGWRAVSILLVIVHHVGWYELRDISSPHLRIFKILQFCGPLGVKVFFVISGFIICRLLIIEECRYGTVSLKAFYVRRAFRILPAFYFYLGVIAIVGSVGLIVNPYLAMFSSALFLHDLYLFNAPDWFVGHSWSLATEEQFYLVFPTLWVRSRKINRAAVFLLLFGAAVAWNLSHALFSWDRLVGFSARPGFACICFGVVLAIYETRVRALVRFVPSVAATALILILLWRPVEGAAWVIAIYECVFIPLAIGVLLIFSLERESWLATLLRWWPLQALGVTSYAIYLWQQLFTSRSDDLSPAGQPLRLLLPLLFVIVPFSWYFIEKPALRTGRRIADRIREQSAAENVAA